MEAREVKVGIAELFREVFEGVAPGADGTWFVQGKEGIFDAIRTLSAAQASELRPGALATIGAHVRHLNYYLSLFNANLRKESPSADWKGSWAVQEFDDAAWAALAADVELEFRFAYDWYQSDADFRSKDQAFYAVANLAHAAYHLGAIRALMVH